MSLLTVGTVAFDTIETPFGKAEHVIGGACTYISWAASYFTNDIHLVSIVGEDFPDSELDALRNRGVNMDGLKIVEGGKSFFWAVLWVNEGPSDPFLAPKMFKIGLWEPGNHSGTLPE